MSEFKKILFPCDLTENSVKIMHYTLSLAEKYDSRICLLHVVRNLRDWGELYVPYFSLEFDQERLLESADKALDKLFGSVLREKPNISKRIVFGEAADEILKMTESDNIDLVVMGTHGRKGLKQTIFGSVANDIVKNSPVPVLVVNPYKEGDSRNTEA
ncbi:universal stress protein [Desulfonema ishimotonii]|uniref:Universal stress protein n=1 Tax=Desulfonema ishimotonii TaxID=45657 RepID=A0A401FWZ4_9BACT|nr:universal stress protein [Desulfonema ishimotonii]GBC61485.1 universal stress protein [Desulfonema ishimotonii]